MSSRRQMFCNLCGLFLGILAGIITLYLYPQNPIDAIAVAACASQVFRTIAEKLTTRRTTGSTT